jgi:solute carrier family 34 (sodium-dependent phosphate cotransporter)
MTLTALHIIQLFTSLYLFLLGIDVMGTAMKMFGKGFAEAMIASTANPLVGLFIGTLATSLIQSSSSTTSITVVMVGSGVLTVPNAIPIIMGANIGTSVTNTLVSLAHIRRSQEFRRSFSASTVHDFFNLLSVIVWFPLQYFTNFLGLAAAVLARQFQNAGVIELFNPVKSATKPMVHLLLQWVGPYPWILLVLSLVLLLLSLNRIVDALRTLLVKRAEVWFDQVLFKTAFRAFVVGLILTVLVQSSSITTSLIIPMAGAGILNLEQIYPYTLGANVGTTFTALLAALATTNLDAVTVAFVHLLFNIAGMVVWWPLRKVPLYLSRKIADFTLRSRLIPFAYVIVVFFLIPAAVIIIFR